MVGTTLVFGSKRTVSYGRSVGGTSVTCSPPLGSRHLYNSGAALGDAGTNDLIGAGRVSGAKYHHAAAAAANASRISNTVAVLPRAAARPGMAPWRPINGNRTRPAHW